MELSSCFEKRHSVRRYTAEVLSDFELREILDAALLAPSSRNLKSAEFIVVTDRTMLEKLSCSKTAGGSMLKEAAAAIVVVGNKSVCDVWIEDCSVAMTYMMLKATDLGIGSCWVQCRNRGLESESKPADEILRNLLHIPEDYQTLAILSLGHPASPVTVSHSIEASSARVHRDQF